MSGKDYKLTKAALIHCLESNEEILFCGDDVHSIQMAKMNPVVTAISLYFLFSGLFWVCIALNIMQSSASGGSLWSGLATSWLSILLVIGIGFAMHKYYPRLKVSLKETKVIITNFRIFQAPPVDDVSITNWAGPHPKDVVWFADSLSITKGPHASNPLLVINQLNHDYCKHDLPVIKTRLVSVKQLNEAYEKLPAALKIDDYKRLKSESEDKFYLRLLSALETRNTRLGLPGVKPTGVKRLT